MAPPDLAALNGIPAGYGRSCMNCSRAKCKCILRTEGTSCERCHRLGKDCQPMASARKRVAKKTTSSRTAQLEEKLDDLVSILRASQHPSRQTPSSQTTPTFEPSQTFPSRLDSLATAAARTPPHQPSTCGTWEGKPAAYNVYRHTSSGRDDAKIDEPTIDPTAEEAEVYLDKFRGWLKHFPFMIIPPEMTAETLREQRPFLWRCIMNVTSMSVAQQTLMRDKVRQEVAQRLVVDHERTMDILLGLICYVAWATMNAGPGTKPFLIAYLQLATTILYDLGMSRSPIEEQYFTVCFKVWGGRPPPSKLRTMEERRAILSLWFLTSVCTSFVGKMDTLRWTSHMDECLEVLEREKETPLDEVLVTLIKLQLVSEDTQKLLVRDVMGDTTSQTPTYVFRKGLMTRLQTIRDSMPAISASNCSVQTRIWGAEMLIHSLGLFLPNIPDAQRIDSMYSCLRAVRAWYDLFFAQPVLEMPGLPFSFYVELSQTHVALYRLTTSEDPAWDKQILRNTIDLLDILDRTIDRFQEASDLYYPVQSDQEEGTLFTKGVKLIRNIRNSWEPALSQHLGGLPTPTSQGLGSNSAPEPAPVVEVDNVMTDPTLDFTDLAWMTDVFGPWEL